MIEIYDNIVKKYDIEKVKDVKDIILGEEYIWTYKGLTFEELKKELNNEFDIAINFFPFLTSHDIRTAKQSLWLTFLHKKPIRILSFYSDDNSEQVNELFQEERKKILKGNIIGALYGAEVSGFGAARFLQNKIVQSSLSHAFCNPVSMMGFQFNILVGLNYSDHHRLGKNEKDYYNLVTFKAFYVPYKFLYRIKRNIVNNKVVSSDN